MNVKKIFFVTYALVPLTAVYLLFSLLKDEQQNKTPITIGFTGDVMLGRLVNEKISQVRDYAYPWGNMLEYLKKTNLNIINLETTLTTSQNPVPKVFNFKADPDKVQSLLEGSIDIVSLANNHSKDFGDDGLLETISVLDRAGIKHVGAGINGDYARKAVITTVNGLRIGILGYTDNEPGWIAGPTSPGTNYIEVGDIARIQEDIQSLKGKVDIIIATLHWGPNKRERPSQEFIDFAHQMVDAGVDIIHGHSAHIFQGIEVYNRGLILYDTGDFVDDYAIYSDIRNDLSFFFIVEIQNKQIRLVKLIPVVIKNMQVNKAQKKDAQQAIDRMKDVCKQFNTETEIGIDGELKIYVMK